MFRCFGNFGRGPLAEDDALAWATRVASFPGESPSSSRLGACSLAQCFDQSPEEFGCQHFVQSVRGGASKEHIQKYHLGNNFESNKIPNLNFSLCHKKMDQASPGFSERYLLDTVRFSKEVKLYEKYVEDMINLLVVNVRKIVPHFHPKIGLKNVSNVRFQVQI
jgi:hypothetical protein